MNQLAIRDLRDDPIALLRALAARHGGVAAFRLGRQHVWLLSHPDLIHRAWVASQRSLGKWSLVRRWWARRPPSFMDGDVLFRTHDQGKHLGQRRAVHPAFRTQRLLERSPALAALLDDYLAAASAADELDLLRLAAALQTGATASALFDMPLRFEQALGVADWFESSMRATVLRTFSSGAYLVRDAVAARAHVEAAERAQEQLDVAVQAIAAHDTADSAALQRIFCAAGVGDIPAETQSMLASAVSTAPPFLRLLLAVAAQNDLVGRVAAEVGAAESPFGSGLLDALPVAYGTVMEAMRLGAGWQVSRLCNEDLAIDGHRFHRGDVLFVCPYLVHRDPRWFPEPDEWRPERWLPTEVARRPRLSFLTFGVGNRVCLGRDLSIVAGLALLIVLIRGWAIELSATGAAIEWRAEPAGGHVRPRDPVLGRVARAESLSSRSGRRSSPDSRPL